MTTDRLGILVSRGDAVSVRIGEQLRTVAEWDETTDDDRPVDRGGGAVYRRPGVEMRTITERHLDTDGIAEAFDDVALIAVASRHAGDTGPLLTAHHTGNFGPAEHGGADAELARAAPNAHRQILHALDEHAPAGYEVGMECTHHGPTDVGVPSLFVEVGSGPDQWDDEEAIRAAAEALLDLTDVAADRPGENGSRRHLVGFGGGHYAPRFERIVRETDWAVGHVAADWCLDEMGDPTTSRDVLQAAFAESAADFAVLEDDRPALAETIQDLGYRVVGETWVRETSGVALALVESLEDAIGPVEAGLRFGARASEHEGPAPTPVVGEIPAELVDAANAVDQDETLAAVESATLAYGTEHGGSRIVGPVGLAGAEDEDALLDALLAVLAHGYDAVEHVEDEIRLGRQEFDPALAREAGVSPGPAFGRLADGESVTVDGEQITPEQVTVERERVLPASVLDS